MKHVFITGAAGFLGEHIVRAFLDDGWHVLALVHRTIPATIKIHRGQVTCIHGDITKTGAIHSDIDRFLAERGVQLDAIVHCAARASDTGWRSAFRTTNYEAVENLVHMSRALDCQRFVFISTTDVYGLRDYHGEQEDELTCNPRPRNPYPVYKLRAEQMLQRELPPEKWSIIRPAQVWGQGDKTLAPRIVNFLRHAPCIIHFGKWRGTNRWPLAHVSNVATATLLAATAPQAGGKAINIVDNEHTTIEAFYRILANVYLPDKTFRSITLPFWCGYVYGAIISTISNLLNLDHPFTDPSLYALYSVSHNLDFGNQRMQELFHAYNKPITICDVGVATLCDDTRHEKTVKV